MEQRHVARDAALAEVEEVGRIGVVEVVLLPVDVRREEVEGETPTRSGSEENQRLLHVLLHQTFAGAPSLTLKVPETNE